MVRWVMMIWLGLAGMAQAGEMPKGMAEADVVLLGEVHDNAVIHARQAEFVKRIRPRAMVFEMLTSEQAAKAVPEVRADSEMLKTALSWDESGWPDFSMYYPVFEAGGEALFLGAAVPRNEAYAAMEKGVPESFGEGAARFGLTSALPQDEQEAREALQHAAHCEALPKEMLPVMVELQRLRDAMLARTVLEALEATGGPVVVITGNGHVRKDWGVPSLLEKAQPGISIFAMGLVEEGGEGEGQFDAEESFPQAEREDPCGAFEKG
ncbi:ChaN family lipoprotein [Rhodobacteraceae bacterium LMO-12]|nr:ChaN family lipoprotein [Rhodobacteraceae bacterium LMO-JJ12]